MTNLTLITWVSVDWSTDARPLFVSGIGGTEEFRSRISAFHVDFESCDITTNNVSVHDVIEL